MDTVENKQITILLAGRPYPLKIKASDEPTIRKIVKDANEKINRFQLTYNQRDKQDCMAMTVLTYAVDLHKASQNGQVADPDLSKKVEDLDTFLNQLLST